MGSHDGRRCAPTHAKAALLCVAALALAGCGGAPKAAVATSPPEKTTGTNPAEPVRELPRHEVSLAVTGCYALTEARNTVAYSMDPVVVPAHHRIVLTFHNTDECGNKHDWAVDEVPGAETRILLAGESERIEFEVEGPATYKFYCSLGNGAHRNAGMEGDLVIEGRGNSDRYWSTCWVRPDHSGLPGLVRSMMDKHGYAFTEFDNRDDALLTQGEYPTACAHSRHATTYANAQNVWEKFAEWAEGYVFWTGGARPIRWDFDQDGQMDFGYQVADKHRLHFFGPMDPVDRLVEVDEL